MKKCVPFCLLFFIPIFLFAQKKQAPSHYQQKTEAPKLVVGLVIDQMRWDYLQKFRSYYGAGGFNRLMGEGYNCDNTLITHIPTYTAVGHAGIFTGSFPSIHGIVGNHWKDRISGEWLYCTDDSTVEGVGSNNALGKMSPRNMLSNTVGDQLRQSNNYKSKVIGISIKDRSSILPAGHSANAAYWFDENTGKMISSTYYMNQLPSWVDAFNDRKMADSFLTQDWTLSNPLINNTIATKDDMSYEENLPGLNYHVFPYQLSSIKTGKYKSFKYTPYGMSYTFAFAKKAIAEERLGNGPTTDLLTLSISSTDYIGHIFGPNSLEILDAYYRLDAELAAFLNYLDNRVGIGNYLLFLTADHGVANNPDFLQSQHEQGGNYKLNDLIKEINDSLNIRFGISRKINGIDNSQIYLNAPTDSFELTNDGTIKSYIVDLLKRKPYIGHAFQLTDKTVSFLPDRLRTAVSNSYFFKRSGDIMIVPNAGWMDGNSKGSNHGLWNPYDSHIPLIWFGWKIKSGHDAQEYHMCDIAPTLSYLLSIQMPNGCMGQVILNLLK